MLYLCCCLLLILFFFKQKTSDEMRISDWSSDVCSSDLPGARNDRRPRNYLRVTNNVLLVPRTICHRRRILWVAPTHNSKVNQTLSNFPLFVRPMLHKRPWRALSCMGLLWDRSAHLPRGANSLVGHAP